MSITVDVAAPVTPEGTETRCNHGNTGSFASTALVTCFGSVCTDIPPSQPFWHCKTGMSIKVLQLHG